MQLVLNPNSDLPLYVQLYTQISEQILKGTLASGTKLPPIRTIANDFKISVIPVKMAWEELDKNGFIQTVTGIGTFVKTISQSEIKQKQETKLLDFIEQIQKMAQEKNIDINELIEALNKLPPENAK